MYCIVVLIMISLLSFLLFVTFYFCLGDAVTFWLSIVLVFRLADFWLVEIVTCFIIWIMVFSGNYSKAFVFSIFSLVKVIKSMYQMSRIYKAFVFSIFSLVKVITKYVSNVPDMRIHPKKLFC